MKMKLGQVLEIFGELRKTEDLQSNHIFAYGSMRNYKLCETETQIVKKFAEKPIEGAEEYRKLKDEIVRKYTKLRADKQPITQIKEDGLAHYVFTSPEAEKAFTIEIEELNKNQEKYFEAVRDKQKELEKMLEQEVEIDFIKIPLESFPDKITPKQMRILECMIKEDKK